MALTTIQSANRVKQWDDKFHLEYVRGNWFKSYMGTSENAVIQVKEDLTKKKGDRVGIPLITRLRGRGVRGNNTLEGSEQALGNYDNEIPVYFVRDAVASTLNEEQATAISIRNAARAALKNQVITIDRDDTIIALQSMGKTYALISGQELANSNYTTLADETQKDAYLGQNLDRFLFGAALSNTSTTDHSASLANIDNTDDKLDAGMVSLAKRIAQTADPHIRPIMTKDGEEWFVMFCASTAMRDLRADTTISAANREAWQRWERMSMTGGTNPIFRGGDILYDGVICREIPEMQNIASTISVSTNYLCGAQAMSQVWAKRVSTTTDVRDYNFVNGVGFQMMRGIEKNVYDNTAVSRTGIQHGVVTVYAAGVADS